MQNVKAPVVQAEIGSSNRRILFDKGTKTLGLSRPESDFLLFMSSGFSPSISHDSLHTLSVPAKRSLEAKVLVIDLLILNLLIIFKRKDLGISQIIDHRFFTEWSGNQEILKDRYQGNRELLKLNKLEMDGVLSMGISDLNTSKGVSYRKELPADNKNARNVRLKELFAQGMLLILQGQGYYIPSIVFNTGLSIKRGPYSIEEATSKARDDFLAVKKKNDERMDKAQRKADEILAAAKSESDLALNRALLVCSKLGMGVDPMN